LELEDIGFFCQHEIINLPVVVMCLALRICLPLAVVFQAMAVELPHDLKVGGAELSIYPPGATQASAECKVDRVFLDHRKLGFFHVRVLPVLVAQGVNISLSEASVVGDWLQELQSNLAPDLNRQAVEWREVELTFQGTNAAHLHAKMMRLAEGGDFSSYHLEDATLEVNGATWRMPKADLQTKAGNQQVVWRTAAGDWMHWNLFTNTKKEIQ
jgi:hypothetical protein